MSEALDKRKPKVPNPFPLDFDTKDGPCLVCGGELDTGWECTDCGADHRDGVRLIEDLTDHKAGNA